MLKLFRYISLGIVFITFANSCKKSGAIVSNPITPMIAPPPPFGFYVVGYFPSYRTVASVPDIKFRMCNVINYAFATLNSSGNLVIGNGNHLTDVKNKAKINGAKILLSVNGLAADFKMMAAAASGRTSFIIQLMNLIRAYGLDGADMDWEFPRTDDGTDATYT